MTLGDDVPGTDTVIVAHRGGGEEGREGALKTLEAAADDGFPVEFDLRVLADGSWAVAHDEDVDRILADKSGLVADMSSEEWTGSCILPADADECVHPALWDDVVKSIPDSALLVPELKGKSIPVEKFVDSVREQGLEDRVLVQSFSGVETRKLAAEGLHTLWLVDRCEELDLKRAADDGVEYLGLSANCDKSVVKSAQDWGLNVWVWTPNEVEEAQEWVDAGVDGIFTDAPRRLSKGLELGE
ncbi:MAG: glycerophosphodiester phosphodiesterase [Galactobacter sp.]